MREKPEGKNRLGLWLDEDLVKKVHEARKRVRWQPSVTQWVADAIIEKLERDTNPEHYNVDEFIRGGMS